MKNDGFGWWCKRVGQSFKLYDVLRIDHFRGFASYYSIPFGDENARRGRWIEAPGKELFDRIKEVYPKSKIIAEDLGFITDDVRDLLRHTGFPGMKLLQFAFFDDNSEYLPRTYDTKNTVVYPGSHDSDCTKSWYKQLKGATRARFLKESKGLYSKSGTYKLIEMALGSIANIAIVPMQDYLELENEEARMNTPSVPDGNWGWRISKRYNTESLRNKITNLAALTKRQSRK
jgi:4-alpha-glucanotransferase